MLSYLINRLVATLILSLLLFSTKVISKDDSFSEWIFQVRSESGFLLSQGLVSLKVDKSGSNFYFAACDFLLLSGAITNLTDEGCISTNLDDKKIYVSKNKIFIQNKERFKAFYLNDIAYISEKDLRELGYEITVDQAEMIVQISHQNGLPVDKKNELLGEAVNEAKNSIKRKNSRDFLSFNRFQGEIYKSPSRSGSLIEGDFDFVSGELILKECDEICQNFYQWTKKTRIKGVDLNFSIGNYDLFYFPGKWQRLNNSIAIDLNKKSRKQKFSLDYGETTDYFIYRNGILIRRGKGSIKDIEVDLSEENYFSQYTVKVIDINGRIQSFDLYNGLGMLHQGDYSISAGADNSNNQFGNAQIGITKNLNFSAGTFNTQGNQHLTKRINSSFKHLRLEYGEMTNAANDRENQFEQSELSFRAITYIYNHRNDNVNDRDYIQQTVLLTPQDFLIQFQNRLTDRQNTENEYLLGKRLHDYFIYGSFLKDSFNQETKSIKLSSANNLFNYDLGISTTKGPISYFALLSGDTEHFRLTTNLDIRPTQRTVGSRLDYRIGNKNAYATVKYTNEKTELGIGLTYNFFPSDYKLKLETRSSTIIKTIIYLDANENEKRDPGEKLLAEIGGTINNTSNYKNSDENGSMYFEVDNNFNSVIFTMDESTFTEMYLLPPKDNLKLEILPRKVNLFEIPIKINGVILIECSGTSKIKKIEIMQKEEKVFSKSACMGPIFLDQKSPGQYKIIFKINGKTKTRKIELKDENKYFYNLLI